jgi:hypothetical protein
MSQSLRRSPRLPSGLAFSKRYAIRVKWNEKQLFLTPSPRVRDGPLAASAFGIHPPFIKNRGGSCVHISFCGVIMDRRFATAGSTGMASHLGDTVLRAALSAAGANRLTDRELLAQFSEGDQSAFAAIVKRHTGLVLGVCRRVLPLCKMPTPQDESLPPMPRTRHGTPAGRTKESGKRIFAA